MNTPLAVRAAALVVSMVIACGAVDLIAHYAYPETPTVAVLAVR